MERSHRVAGLTYAAQLVAIVAAIVALGAPAVRASETQQVAQAASALVHIRVGGQATDDITPVLYAVRAGLFRKAGLDVDLQHGDNSSAVAAAIVGGTFDIGKVQTTSIIRAHEKGVPLTIIAPAAIYDAKTPMGGLLVAKTTEIRTSADLAGKRIGVITLGGTMRIAVDAWMVRHGGDPKQLIYTELPVPACFEALKKNRVDMCEIVYPALAAALESPDVKLFPAYSAVAPLFAFSAWVSSTDWASKNPEAARTFARVIAEAATYTNAHPQETAQMLSDYTSVPLDEIRSMPRTKAGVAINVASVQAIIETSVKAGVIPQSFPAGEIIIH